MAFNSQFDEPTRNDLKVGTMRFPRTTGTADDAIPEHLQKLALQIGTANPNEGIKIISYGDPVAQPGPYQEEKLNTGDLQGYDTKASPEKENRVPLTYFEQELRRLINKYSIENRSNTPDLILAEYLSGCLNAFNIAVKQREQWYGRKVF